MPALARAGQAEEEQECEQDEQPPHRAGQVIAAQYDPQRWRSGSSWWRTAARSPSASFAPAASSGSRPSPSPRPTTAARCTPAPPTRRSRSAATSTSEEHIRAAHGVGRRRDPSRLRLPGRERRLRRGGRGGRADLGRAPGGGAPARRRQARGEADRARGGRSRRARRASRRSSASRCSSKRRRAAAARDARRTRAPPSSRKRWRPRAREAQAAFGDGTRLLRALRRAAAPRRDPAPRDAHGTVLSLGERDCSVQRRHQKVLEESPSPALDPAAPRGDERRGRAFARAIGYRERRHGRVHAGGPRVLLPRAERTDPGRASGDRARHRRRPRPRAAPRRGGRARSSRVPRAQGHAVEVRLYAEDPRSFLPQAGTVERLRLPTGVRVDAGVEEGDEIGTPTTR